MAAVEAIEFLKKDHGDKGSGAREDFAQDRPYRSLLQRQEKTLPEVLEIFEWQSDDTKWISEYSQPEPEVEKLIRYRRRVSFCVGGWRELNEDFRRSDVSCIKDLRTPFVTSRSPIRASKDDFNEK